MVRIVCILLLFQVLFLTCLNMKYILNTKQFSFFTCSNTKYIFEMQNMSLFFALFVKYSYFVCILFVYGLYVLRI